MLATVHHVSMFLVTDVVDHIARTPKFQLLQGHTNPTFHCSNSVSTGSVNQSWFLVLLAVHVTIVIPLPGRVPDLGLDHPPPSEVAVPRG